VSIWSKFEELIKFKDLIKLLMGLIGLIKDLIELKNKFKCQFGQNLKN
jgi:hypothetical protein